MAEAGGAREQADDERTSLRRAVTPAMLVIFVVGDMVGGGIYALVGEVGGEVGGAIWSGFVLALALALFTAGSYAELVTKYPRRGRRGALHPEGVRPAVRDLHARLRGDDELDHLGGRALARLRRRRLLVSPPIRRLIGYARVSTEIRRPTPRSTSLRQPAAAWSIRSTARVPRARGRC